ncbi:FCD domain-containing protein [Jatrophihabitans telluris]|uniref:FCD domain-containing protein n=1 Tax=Jatrophihabitans telluris TaxID=2038343 RepID=A0ABY4R1A1_9ACTN|nr:FCD domain-containing protein [Jatrophihabitans telluris]UQX89082.1 FCD domain-containing protein [Jatrophihabitans telluris]
MTAPGPGRSYQRVIGYVEEQLSDGRLSVGDKLPAERSLAADLGLSRASVREGLRVLEAMGLVRTGTGSGPDAGAVLAADTTTAISVALRLHLASATLPVSDVVASRVVLESWAVSEAARRTAAGRAKPDLSAATELVRAMDEPGIGPEAFYRLDAQFHVALARAAGNEVIAAIMASLRDAIQTYVVAAGTVPDWPRMLRRLRTQHRAVLAAIDAGEPELAARHVVAHINGFYRSTWVSE